MSIKEQINGILTVENVGVKNAQNVAKISHNVRAVIVQLPVTAGISHVPPQLISILFAILIQQFLTALSMI